jgi:hypothetical protein
MTRASSRHGKALVRVGAETENRDLSCNGR